jgi:hypothetical protein
MDEKRCTRCGERKPLDSFPLSRHGAAGRGVWCKQCHRDYSRVRYADKQRGHSLEDAFEPRF